MKKKINVITLTRFSRFPYGMAASRRITMIGRIIIHNGDNVKVLCLSPTETKCSNLEYKGEHFGIKYEFTCGTACQSNNILMRQLYKMRGIFVAIFNIALDKIRNRVDIIYIYDRAFNIQYLDLFFILYARLLGIKVIREMNERPWSLKLSPSFIERHVSPLYGVNGVIAISSMIKTWIESENLKKNFTVSVVKIPILTDINEFYINENKIFPFYILFAGSPMYDDTIKYILDSMELVWRKFPMCKLFLTGFYPEDESGNWIKQECRKRAIEDNVNMCGYLTRADLLKYYAGAKALLIPLFDDIRSKARFPTKIAEYLASSVPIITNMIGEIPYYFKDGVNAFIAKPNDPTAYAKKIIECLENPNKSKKIGYSGKIVAEKNFKYEAYADILKYFLDKIIIK
jgi:glycosyltransferase involved in cell wall biosynthesis